ncbi:NrfD/PsrC family molybdoenzyme membrane anchor subunit [Carboxydocella sp. JDF658]|uniref:NrfD/PsrC family molybdoenzyme membrane anchor subunit n=1 Tax=Carboxydocella sp. JDF658 TaxID=1926600 RepID=UPI0009AEC4E2|nr:NrfD/PsrC family molybdoenzyme membrane anchor subunit [Carboxydocella sp. JDF658]GAW31060.1 hypothetical protein JDF658_08250 [Carboxydocella sp. JDF658]
MAWGTIIAAYLFLAGVSAGAFLTAVNAPRLWPRGKWEALTKSGILLAIPLMALGLLLLVFDAEAGLKAPWRFLYLFLNFPGSMMTNGTIIISLYMLVLLYCGWLVWKKQELPRWLVTTGNLLALGTAGYTGLLIGVVNTVPLWNTAVLPVLFLVSALSTGMAAAVITALWLDGGIIGQLQGIKKVHLGLLIGELILLFFLVYVTGTSSDVARQSVDLLLTGKFAALFWGGLIGLGLVLPLLIEWWEMGNAKHENKALTVLSEVMVLSGGFILRYLILAAALPVNLLG